VELGEGVVDKGGGSLAEPVSADVHAQVVIHGQPVALVLAMLAPASASQEASPSSDRALRRA
jgi:hypothetical protein